MTAPAVARRWVEASPAGEGRLGHGGLGLAALVGERVVTARRVAPLGAVLLTALVGQVAVASHLAVGGVAPEAMLVTVAAVAMCRGPRAGAAFGFAAGLGADLFRATPLGTAALAFTVVGHLLGRCRRPPAAGTAAALCRPESTCFACRTGRPLRSRAHSGPTGRVRRQQSARREARRRAVALSLIGVAAGRLATAMVATGLAGVPFPPVTGLLRIAAAAVISAPLGPPVFAAVRRVNGSAGR
ncbi:MAG TPA: rod shape-determining protein MreD [Acidimicrobiia bacterium]